MIVQLCCFKIRSVEQSAKIAHKTEKDKMHDIHRTRLRQYNRRKVSKSRMTFDAAISNLRKELCMHVMCWVIFNKEFIM